MCELCIAEAITIGEFMPGYQLVRATREGAQMHQHDFGISRGQCPDFIFSTEPLEDPNFEIDEEHEEDLQWTMSQPFWQAVSAIEEQLEAGPLEGYRLVSAALEAGYDPEKKHGYRFAAWLVHQMGKTWRAYKEQQA